MSPASRTALVIGITGQDGSYLAEFLLQNGYRVVGLARKSPGEAARSLPGNLATSIELATWNMLETETLAHVLQQWHPAEIYNCAALSAGSGMYDDALHIGEINGLAVARILEAIRAVNAEVRFCQASSSEIFANTTQSPQSEETAVCPRSPYGAAKSYADFMIRIYRERYGLFACSAILFNHESPRRGSAFVSRKIAREAVRIKRGRSAELRLGNLSARRDWGFAGDYVRAMWLILQHSEAQDFVVGSGESHSVSEFCEHAFGYLGLNYRDYVRETSKDYRPMERVQLVGNIGKARRVLNWVPQVGFRALVMMMVDAELHALDAAE